MNAKRFQRIAGNAIAVMVSLITCIPVYLVIVNALKTARRPARWGLVCQPSCTGRISRP